MSTIAYTLPGAVSLARIPILSKEAKRRLAWFDYYRRCKNAAQTCRYFGISRKTFYYWHKRYQPYHLVSLEAHSKRPLNTRRWQVSRMQEFRILALRRQYIRYGKEKLKVLYQNQYQERISSWKIQRVIEKHDLYYHPQKIYRQRKKRRHNQAKRRITELKKLGRSGFLIALDGITMIRAGMRRYILTGIDIYSKIAFARMYTSKHSKHAADFLKRIHYLLEGKIENIQTDNGSEFAKDFRDAMERFNLPHYLSRPKTPTDNPFDERFNRTLKEEFIALGNYTSDCAIFNQKLTEWLIEYNFHRPHQALGYSTPINFHYKHHRVLPMYPSSKQVQQVSAPR
jgi:transposase InsO family protein